MNSFSRVEEEKKAHLCLQSEELAIQMQSVTKPLSRKPKVAQQTSTIS
jgi:hypothetical protein